MSRLNCFYIKDGVSLTDDLINDIEKELVSNSSLVNDYYLGKDEILVNLMGGFETIAIPSTVNELRSPLYLKFNDGTVFSGFKYYNGASNVLAYKIMLLAKYHLGSNIVICSEDLEDGITSEFTKAIDYLQSKGYDIVAKDRENSRSPYIRINGNDVDNIFDEDGSIFKSMFTLVEF